MMMSRMLALVALLLVASVVGVQPLPPVLETRGVSQEAPAPRQSDNEHDVRSTDVAGAAEGQRGAAESAADWWIVLFTGILTLVAVLQLVAMRTQFRYMRDGLAEARKSADAAAAQTRLARQQLIGTMAAVLRGQVSQTDAGFSIGIRNSGGVDGRDLEGSVQITPVDLPSLQPRAGAVAYSFSAPLVPRGGGFGKIYAFPSEWLPPRHWSDWHHTGTVLIEVRYSWNNGFDEALSDSLRVVYLPSWQYSVRGSGTRGQTAMFHEAAAVAELWRDVGEQLRLGRSTQDPPGWGSRNPGHP